MEVLKIIGKVAGIGVAWLGSVLLLIWLYNNR